MTYFTRILNLTINENDNDSHSDISEISVHSATDINQFSKHSATDIKQLSKHSATEDRQIILGGEIKDSKEQKEKNKRKKQPDLYESTRAKRQCLQPPPTSFSRVFPETESFQRPEFLSWLKSNQHLRRIKGGISKVCELLDKVRMENSGLDEIFFALAENNEKVDPHFFDIKELVRRNDSIIFPPEWGKWNKPTASAATYIWSFDIPITDIEGYCREIEENIHDHPHKDLDTDDYRPFIVAQFRNYLANKLPLRKKVEVFHWLYVGQTEQRPPTNRWMRYYKKDQNRQRTLNFAMHTLVKRGVPHRLVVVSQNGSKDTEAIVAALLNIRVASDGKEANAINRTVCGRAWVGEPLLDHVNRQTVALENYNCETHMIMCAHCEQEIFIRKENANLLESHRCSASGLKRKGAKHTNALVDTRLDVQSYWCPRKDSCEACAVIVPRRKGNLMSDPMSDLMSDLPLEEILLKNDKWKKNRQCLVLQNLDTENKKVICMHCHTKVTIQSRNGHFRLRHGCTGHPQRKINGKFQQFVSNLYYVYPWCVDKMNCKSCIQIVNREFEFLSAHDKHKKILQNFNFCLQRIICVHCNREQKLEAGRYYRFNPHWCNRQPKHVRGKLFQKMAWCRDKECTECFRIEDRQNNIDSES